MQSEHVWKAGVGQPGWGAPEGDGGDGHTVAAHSRWAPVYVLFISPSSPVRSVLLV